MKFLRGTCRREACQLHDRMVRQPDETPSRLPLRRLLRHLSRCWQSHAGSAHLKTFASQSSISAPVHEPQVPRADAQNIYVRIPHQLNGACPDHVMDRVTKFYRQTFWTNIDAFKCCQAAQVTRRLPDERRMRLSSIKLLSACFRVSS